MKKLLALVLALVMSMSLVTISNAAFSDADKIDHTEAVEVMNALGVINGMPDGSFNPSGNVTRAEMAKMISIIMLGDIDAAAFVGTTTDLKDINGHWAEGFIKYCYSQGVIAGRGDGTFAPNANVTAVEAAKMLCVALGYNATVQGYVGGDWAINIIRDAQLSKLFDDLSVASTKVLTRDEAAQMIYNAINAKMIEKTPSISITDGKITYSYNQSKDKTLLGETFKGKVEYAYLTKTEYDSDKKTYTYSHSNSAFGGDTITADDDALSSSIVVKSANDYSELFGQKIKVVYKNDAKAGYPVYGIYAADSKVVVSTVVDKLPTIKADDETVKIGDVEYKLEGAANTIDCYNFNVNASVAKLNALETNATKPYTVALIDLDNNNKIDCAVVYPVSFAKVSFVGSSSITNGNIVYKFSKSDIYDGVAKDDYTVVTAKANTKNDTPVIAKAEIVTGTIDAVKTGEVRIGGTWYSVYTTVIGNPDLSVGNEVKVAVYNGFIVGGSVVDAAALESVVYVADVSGTAGNAEIAVLGSYEGTKVRVLMADGTNKVVKATRVDVTSETDGVSDDDDDLVKTIPGKGLYTYTVNKDGVYELKAVKADTTGSVEHLTAGYVFAEKNLPSKTSIGSAATANATYNKTNAKIGTNLIADDAVIYLVKTSTGTAAGTYDKAKIVNGKTLKTMASWGDNAVVLTKSVNGMATVVVGVLFDDAVLGNSEASTGYGYVTGTGYAFKNADKEWNVTFKVWNGTEEVELTATDATSSTIGAKYTKGAFVSYTTSATAGEVTKVTVIGTPAYIKGYDGDKNINLNGTAMTFNEDGKTKVIFVNTADVKGVEGGSIALANEPTSGSFIQNAVFFDDASFDGIEVLFVDVNNKLEGGYTTTGTGASVAAGATAADVKALADGAYVPTDGTFGTIAGTAANNRIFKFSGISTSATAYVLTVKNSAGATVYTETATFTDASVGMGHYFYITLDALQNNQETPTGTWASPVTEAPAGTYTYAVTAGTTVVLSGAFIK